MFNVRRDHRYLGSAGGKSFFTYGALLFSLALAACQNKEIELNSHMGTTISGSAAMFSAVSSSSMSATSTCSSAQASLHIVNDDGSMDSTAQLSAPLNADGSFNLLGARQMGVNFKSSKVFYVIKVSGCGMSYYRPLTAYKNQKVTEGSTLIALVADVDDPTKRSMSKVSIDEINRALDQIDAAPAADLTEKINQVIASTSLTQEFQAVTNISPERLKELAPGNLNLTAPALISEASPNHYSASIIHWNSDYQAAYEWKLDGVVVSTASNWVYTPNKNSQGLHTLELKVGLNNGSGFIDLTKPTKASTQSIEIHDNYPATAPVMSLVGGTPRNYASGNLQIATGAGRINCESFSSLALTTNAVTPPPASAFTMNCTTGPVQVEPFMLATGDGPTTLALWVRDASGNISTTATSVTILLDQTNPAITLSNMAALRGGTYHNLNYSASDVTAGLQTLSLEYASNGTTYAPLADLLAQTPPYPWNTPAVNVPAAKLRLTAVDFAGNSSVLETAAFEIDSTNPVVTITSPAVLAASVSSATLEGTCESGLAVTISGDVQLAPVTATCSAGLFSQTINYAGGDGIKNVVVTQTDAAGNSGTDQRNFIKDSGPPILNFSTPAPSTLAKDGLIITGDCEEGLTVSISGTGVDAPSTAPCSGGVFNRLITFSAGDGTKTVQISQTDLAGNNTMDNRSFERSTVAPHLTLTSPLANAEAQTGVTLIGLCDPALDIVIGGSGTTANGFFTCAGNSTFSIPINFTAGEGPKDVLIEQTDAIGNVTSINRTFIRDTIAPDVTITGPAVSASGQTGITVTGTCEAGITVHFSGAGLANVVSDPCTAGTFSQMALFTAGEGVKNIVVTQTDPAGNSDTDNRDFVRDNTAPVLAVTSPAASSVHDASVSLTGTCEPGGSSITISGDVNTPSNTACSSGTFSALVTFSSGDGTKAISLGQNDAAGNTGSLSHPLINDTASPVVNLTSLTGGQIVRGGSAVSITWTATDANFGSTPISLHYSSNGGTSWTPIASSVANSGSYSWTAPMVNGTNFRVRVTAVDVISHSATSASASSFTIDSSAPVLSLTSHNGGQIIRGGSTSIITWSATDSNFGATPISLEYTTNGGTTWTTIASSLANSGSFSWTVPLINSASVRIRVTAEDLATNVSFTDSAVNFSVDSTAPTINLTSLTGGQIIAGGGASRAITWTANDLNFGSTPILIEYSADAGSTWSTIAPAVANTGTYNWTVSVADGTQYRIRITATDAAGWSTSVASVSNFSVDSNAPALTQTTLSSPFVSASATSVTFGGTCDLNGARMGSGTDITVSGAATAIIPCTGSAPTGSWTYTVPTQSTDGVRHYDFSQTSLAALTTTITATWIRDTVPPVVTAVMVNDGDIYLNTTTAAVSVTASDALYGTGLQVRVAATDGAGANCQALYANNRWNDHLNPTMTWLTLVPDGDGTKKLCAWAKDAAGNVSVISPAAGSSGVNMDTVEFANSSPPRIDVFTVTNANDGSSNYGAGELVKISWTVTDSLGLATNPIRLEYTQDGTNWLPIEMAYGSLSGNPTSYSYDYYGFNAPAGFFRVRIVAKNLTGQTSYTLVSESQNSSAWSVYAGSLDRGVGGAAKSASFYRAGGARNKGFSFDPLNGDLYVWDDDFALKRIDARTGIVHTVIKSCPVNLPDDGPLPASPCMDGRPNMVTFDGNRKMYIMRGSIQRTATSAQIYQVDLVTNHVRFYVGSKVAAGSSKFDNTATNTDVFVMASDFVFDEANTMYFTTTCSPGAWNSNTATARLMKMTQNPDGSPGTVSVVAGDCSKGNPVIGANALLTPFANTGDGIYHSLAVWNYGAVIYYSTINDELYTYKILNGVVNTTTLPNRILGWARNPANNNLVIVPYPNAASIFEYSTNPLASNGENLVSTLTSNGGSGDCMLEGSAANALCTVYTGAVTLNQEGKPFFGLGPTGTNIRIGYINNDNKLSLYAGSLPFDGDGRHKSLVRSQFGGIYYKKATEPNQAAFPEGLYFFDRMGMVMGRIETNATVTALYGNQNQLSSYFSTSTLLTKTSSLGTADTLNGQFLTFDSDGLPWFTYSGNASSQLLSIDATYHTVRRTYGASNIGYWNPGDPATGIRLYTGSALNIALKKNDRHFTLGRYYQVPAFPDQGPNLRMLDFTNNQIVHLMGVTGGVSSSADSPTAGSLGALSFDGYCSNNNCAVSFSENNPVIPTDDRLYFSERNMLRYITDPSTASNHTLTTVFTSPSVIQNFTIRPDQNQVFYVMGTRLYCHPLTPAGVTTWCNDSNLGPTTGLELIGRGSNQFTWKNNDELFVNNYKGEIYLYKVPVGP